MVKDTRLSTKLWAAANWALIGFFIVNLFAMIAAVVTSSFSTRWLLKILRMVQPLLASLSSGVTRIRPSCAVLATSTPSRV